MRLSVWKAGPLVKVEAKRSEQSADALVELLWGEDPPRTAAKALQTHISSLRRTLGDGFVLTEGNRLDPRRQRG